MTEGKKNVSDYMEKKLKLLYWQTALNVVQVICLIVFLVWLWAHPDVLREIFGR